jgi:integrase
MDTLKVNFFVDESRINSEGLAPIRVRSRHNSKKLIVKATGFFCHIDEWNNKKGLPHDSIQQNKLMARDLEIKTAYKELSKDRQGITLQDVWDHLNPKNATTKQPRSSELVTDWIEYYINNTPYSPGYIRGVKQLRVHLTGKSKKGKVKAFNPNLKFPDVTQSLVDSFATHMVRQGLSSGSIVKIIKFLKQVAKVALDNGVKVGSTTFKAPRNFKKKAKTEVRLTYPELLKIQDVPLEGNPELVRDIFLFLGFTGMRFSDMVKVTKANDRGEFLLYTQQKTGNEVAVTLNKHSKALVKKYGIGKEETDYIFPPLGQQFINREIKTIARMAGLKEMVKVTSYSGSGEIVKDYPKYKLIKTHTGRRSFSRLLSMAEVPDQTIGEEMGHGGESITRHYIGNTDHRKRIKLVQEAWIRVANQIEPEALMRAI